MRLLPVLIRATMSTTRVTRSASRPNLRSQSSTNVASPSPATTESAKAKNEKKPVKRTKSATKNAEAQLKATLATDGSPSTPPRKRQRKSASVPSPPKEGPQYHDTAKLDSLAEQHVLEETPHPPRPPPARPAEPHGTNALLQTPHGSRVVAYPTDSLDVTSPSKPKAKAKKSKTVKAINAETNGGSSNSILKPTTDTNRLLADGIKHLISVDSRLKPVIDAHHCHVFSPEGLAEPVDPFRALASGILAQQVSGAAAAAIKRRFVALFIPETDEGSEKKTDRVIVRDEGGGDTGEDSYLLAKSNFPTPEQVAKADIAEMRSAGLSQRKAEYVKGLAEKFASGDLSAAMLATASYDEVLEKLIAVRGLGQWSVEMFACFGLKRMDVFSTGDLGVQRGMAAFIGKDVAKLKNKGGKWKYMAEQDMIDMAAKFAPYRSLFMWYMWRVEDVNLDAIQNA